MTTQQAGTDMGIGLALLFAALGVVGTLAMFLGAPDALSAYGFAAAVTFGALAVVALHVYPS
jgi:hypothetical protein